MSCTAPKGLTSKRTALRYTMKVETGKYCNYIPMLEVAEVVPASDWTDDPEYACDFIIQVREHKQPCLEEIEADPANRRPAWRSCLPFGRRETAKDIYEAKMLEYKLRPRPYFLRALDVVERNDWMRDVRRATRLAKLRHLEESNMSYARKAQKFFRRGYQTSYVQSTSSLLILANFAASAYEAQIRPEIDSEEDLGLRKLDLAFTIIFTVELVWNMAAHWCARMC